MSDLQQIPGVGSNMERHLQAIGIHTQQDLVGKDPQAMYAQSCLAAGKKMDPCVLYVYRLAVAYVSSDNPHKADLKWWDFK